MAQPVIQHSFAAGEWAPQLNARVDLQKYHSAAALLRNFFVDYRGGASTRPGTKYILQAYKSATRVRLIPFQASFTVNYVLEFGQNYIRFINNAAYILEATTTITGATQANPCVVTDVAHGYSTGDWVFISGVVGMTQLNGNYYQITRLTANTYSLQDLNGNNIDSTAYTAYSSAGTAARVYTLPSPYAAADLGLLKFAQNVNTLVICHPSYPPQVLTLKSAASWTIGAIVFGSTIPAPGTLSIATSSAGGGNLSYVVTAIDVNGQESAASAVEAITINTAGATVTFGWAAVSGATSYNVYRTSTNLAGAAPSGSAFGYVGYTNGVSFVDTFGAGYVGQVATNFSISPPVAENPFQGAGVAS